MTARPKYRLTLGKTYYDKGFFNLGVEVDRFIRRDSGAIVIRLGDSGGEIQGKVDRQANLNRTPRIFGGAALRNWFHRNFDLGDIVDVDVLAPDKLWIRSTGRKASDRSKTIAREWSNPKREVPNARQPTSSGAHAARPRRSLDLDEYRFERVCGIEPDRDTNGAVRKFLPQSLYSNENNLPLHRYGAGPFCKFQIPSNVSKAGVYAISVDGEVRYIGETVNLSSRYNTGYGNISPRNCFSGGQETNCRINNLILEALDANSQIDLWFLPTDEYKTIEADLRRKLTPSWNGI